MIDKTENKNKDVYAMLLKRTEKQTTKKETVRHHC